MGGGRGKALWEDFMKEIKLRGLEGYGTIFAYHSVSSCLGHWVIGVKKVGPRISNFWRPNEIECGG